MIEPPEITYETLEATVGTIEKKITASGTFVSIEQGKHVLQEPGGRLKKVYVKVGDSRKGDH